MIVRFKKLDPAAVMPTYAHDSSMDAGADLRTLNGGIVAPGKVAHFDTGIAIELPPLYEAQVRGRSGLGFKYGIGVPHGLGTIDPSYRGSIRVALVNHSDTPYFVSAGDRIAQIIVSRYEPVFWMESEELDETERGASGFGSSGK